MGNEKKVAVTLLSEEDIQRIIDKRIADAMRLNVPKPIRKVYLAPKEAVVYMAEMGYRCSLSLLYKTAANEEVPLSKFGRKLTFNADDLDKWIETKKQKCVDVAGNVSRSAGAKMRV